LCTYCASPAAPLGDFCTESLLEKTSIFGTYCASPAAPIGEFCTECRTRGWPALPLMVTLMWSNAEDRRCGLFRHCFNFLRGIFACILHGSASLKTSPPGRKRVRAGIKLFGELQGRVSPEDSNKKNYGDCQCSRNALSIRRMALLACTRWGDTFVLTMKGPSHFGSSLPRDSVRVVWTSTRSPSLNSLGTTMWSRHALFELGIC
jgi:hypothetical protein